MVESLDALTPPQITVDRSFVYVADPMCSWCWGFAPQLETLAERYGWGVDIVVGGLRPGASAQPLDGRMGDYLRGTWTRIADMTGQPFDLSFLDSHQGWVYDTELPARAVVTMRALAPDATFAWFHRLQRAFYAEGIDITDPDSYLALLADQPVEVDPFMARLSSDDSKEKAWEEFALAQRWGITGFPTLLVRDGDDLHLVSQGYRQADGVAAVIDMVVPSAAGEMCGPDGC